MSEHGRDTQSVSEHGRDKQRVSEQKSQQTKSEPKANICYTLLQSSDQVTESKGGAGGRAVIR